MIKYVIFDFDGTLADSQEVFIKSWNQLAKKNNFKEVKMDELDTLKKISIKERCNLLNFPMYKMPLIVPQMYKQLQRLMSEISLFDGIRDMLNQLEVEGYKTAIISSNSKDNILSFLDKNQITNVTDVHCSSSIFGKDKLINKFLKNHHLNPAEVIYVGDEERDVVACKKTGVKIIWVSWGYDSVDVIVNEQPDYKVDKPSQILEMLSGKN
ncbi:HAD-IA family hydrolase [Robertmurraya massiliosenegalensis]|uniref:HAD-IA family hydrolase n=1 Tax=Robertmurraya TaxID=2837507 RepID=UPI0039A65361